MSTYPIITSGATVLDCGQCYGSSAPLVVNGSDATCAACGDVKYIPADIARHMDATEVLVVTPEGHLAYVDLADLDIDDES